ncbi:MAG TPA: alpha/beta hydrolase [Kineosporiaceae bacterium]|nr:alpha/beta hydrolase [Kineosporiaceae bacterium]
MSTFTTSDGCVLDYRDDGPADAQDVLVLLHGWSQSRAMFDRALPTLSRDLRVVTYDQRGHGESAKPEHGARIARLGADLHELLDHLGIDRAHLGGHSMGASVLWSYIDTHGTSRIASLVVVDQPSACVVLPWMDAAEGAAAGAILDFPGAEGFVRAVAVDDRDTRHAFLVSMLTKGITADDLAWMYDENLKLPALWGARLLLDHVMQDWRDLLPRIDVPTLVLAGEVSHVAPASQAWTAEHIPGARLRTFTASEGGSHFPFYENPGPFCEAISGFITDVAHRKESATVGN